MTPAYLQALARAEMIYPWPRIRGTIVWGTPGLAVARQLVSTYVDRLRTTSTPTVTEPGFLVPHDAYDPVFAHYTNVVRIASDAPHAAGHLVRPDFLTTAVPALRAQRSTEPHVGVGGLLRRFDGSVLPLFRDIFIWPCVQVDQRVDRLDTEDLLHRHREVLETWLDSLGLCVRTIDTSVLDHYGRRSWIIVTALPNLQPTVLATIYALHENLSSALGEAPGTDVVDVGFTGKVIALLAMTHLDARGLCLPSMLAPVQIGVVHGDDTSAQELDDLVAGWRSQGLRVGVTRPARTAGGRARRERRWHRAGVPVVVGFDRGPGAVRVATRHPLARRSVSGPPDAGRLRNLLDEHDERLRRRTRRIWERAQQRGPLVIGRCPAHSERDDVLGFVVPSAATACDVCSSPGLEVLRSPSGRFY